MTKLCKAQTYIDPDSYARLTAAAARKKATISHVLKELIERELAQSDAAHGRPWDVEHALQHIAIGVDALLKFGPDARAFEAAKEARQRRLKGPGDGR